MEVVTRIENIFNTLDIKPLAQDDIRYVDLYKARGGQNIVRRLSRKLGRDIKNYDQKIFLYGSRGCGKSTELAKLIKKIEDDYLVVEFSVIKELDPNSFNHIDLLMLIVEKLFEASQKHNIALGKDLLKNIADWLNKEEITKVVGWNNELEAEAAVQAGTDAWFVKVFARLRANSKLSQNIKKTITKKVDAKLSDFLKRCNDLIRDIHNKLNNRGLLVVVEDFDKVPFYHIEPLFIKYHSLFFQLDTKMLFTYPISLVFHNEGSRIISEHEKCELPVMKVAEKNGEPYKQGIEALKQLITKRIAIECFEKEEILDKAIAYSGGCIRDLFRMINDAADQALDEDRDKITEQDLQKSFHELKKNYFQAISETRDKNGNVQVKVEEYYEVLHALAKSKDKQTENNLATMNLRHNLCILSYNGENWADVHPAVKDLL